MNEDEEDTTKREVFTFLDKLRESGKTNMFGAAPYVAEAFSMPITEARDLTMAWAQAFDGNG